jgi:lipoprotein-anchoring transpeptidase ErfK/SrfK
MNRRRLLTSAGASLLTAGITRAGIAPETASAGSSDALANVIWPPDVGQTDLQVYVPETGHTIRGSMLDYWRANGAAAVYGNPISEPFASADGYYSQAFEHAVFQYRPEYQDTEDPIMRLMPIGNLALAIHGRETSVAGRRAMGGGDRRKYVWRPLAADGQSAARADESGGFYDEDTGHTVEGSFLDWYDGHEGDFYLGSPISQPVSARGAVVQYFDGGLMMRDDDGKVRLAPLVSEIARHLGFDRSRVKQGDLPAYDESLFKTAPNPNPVGDQSASGRHWVEVSLGQQRLWAYQGDTAVLETYVSTGLPPNVTAPGLFHVRLKFPSQTMNGFTDSTGEVNGFGTTAPASGGVPWEVKDVPNVMYFSITAEALHGCYWHNNFGNPMSHGCVNLPLDVAAWMYGWAPLGTMVWIHD